MPEILANNGIALDAKIRQLKKTTNVRLSKISSKNVKNCSKIFINKCCYSFNQTKRPGHAHVFHVGKPIRFTYFMASFTLKLDALFP